MELKKGETIMTNATLHLPAAFLHEAFSNRSGVPPDHFGLYYRGKRLEGEAVLASYGIGKDAPIEVKMRGRGGTYNQESMMPQDSERKQTSTSAVHVDKKEEARADEATQDRALQDENAKLRDKLRSLRAQTQANAGSTEKRGQAAGAVAAQVERQAVRNEAQKEAEKKVAVVAAGNAAHVKAQEEAKAVVAVETVTLEAAEPARLRAEKTKAEARAVAKLKAGGTGVSVLEPKLTPTPTHRPQPQLQRQTRHFH